MKVTTQQSLDGDIQIKLLHHLYNTNAAHGLNNYERYIN
jgi:hypothetical protein